MESFNQEAFTEHMKSKAVIFDFNGVLWWDSALQDQAWNEFSKKLRGHPFTPDEMKAHVYGRTNADSIAYVLGRKVEGEELARLVQDKESAYRQLCLDQGEQFQLSPGAATLLDTLTSKQVPITIATSSEITNLQFFFEHLNLERWFDWPQVVYDDGNFRGKPEPDIYLKAAAKLQVAPAQCLVIEDSTSGIEAARRAGIGEIVAIGPQSQHARLRGLPGVTQVVETLAEIEPS